MEPYPKLVDRFAEGYGAVFVGAGLSMGGGLKSWDELISPMRERLRQSLIERGEDPSSVGELSLTEVAEHFEREFSRGELIWAIRDELPRLGGGWTAAHAALLRLPLREVFTTNFDAFIEAAAIHHGIDYDLVVRSEHFAHTRNKLKIIKLHGDYDDPGGIVITESDYDEVYESRRILFDVLRANIAEKALLFLGYSFSDPDLNLLLSRTRNDIGIDAGNIYTVQFNLSPDKHERLKELGVRVIRIPLAQGQQPNDGLVGWLSDFAAQVDAARPTATRAPEVRHNLPIRQREIVGRGARAAKLVSTLREPGARVVLSGPVGVGKSSLALAAAYRCVSEPEPFKAAVWVSARGPIELSAVMDAVEHVTNYRLGPPQKRKGRLEGLLEHNRILLVIDDLEESSLAGSSLAKFLKLSFRSASLLVSTRGFQPKDSDVLEGLDEHGVLEFERSLLRERRWKHLFAWLPDDDLIRFAQLFRGNPQLMRLAFNLVRNEKDLRGLAKRCRELTDEEDISNLLHAAAWRRLSDEGRAAMRATAVFPGATISWAALRAAMGGPFTRAAVARTIDSCVALGLLEPLDAATAGPAARYTVQPGTRAYIARKVRSKERWDAALRRLTEYYLDLIHISILRRRPAVRYWNTLASEGMALIDPEWENIRAVMQWNAGCDDKSDYLQLVMLLVHYMDIRLRTADRKYHVEKAAEIFEALGDVKAAALLRLDALTFTYMGEGHLEEARRQLQLGRRLARRTSGRGRLDLDALSWAWLARLRLERGKRARAQGAADTGLIGRAQRAADRALRVNCRPWIRTRVCMAAGDAALCARDGARALALYQEAARQPATYYGPEGNGYEVLPREGLALIELDNIEAARERFKLLEDARDIPMADLYAAYGQSIADYAAARSSQARESMKEHQQRLTERVTSGLLLATMIEFETDLRRRRPHRVRQRSRSDDRPPPKRPPPSSTPPAAGAQL